MKLADRTVEIHSRGLDSTNQFTIAQTSKMFKILSDSLYSDKVMAVIRELSTNAYDAHVAAGNKNPFRTTLPTQANPNFTVRDYGTGLSQKDMEELYTTYGASNKNDSNDFVGCLGLGSKSPFAYTKSFSTTSYYNGKAYNYIAAMDEGGVPSLNLFGVTETSEPNGLEISFAVKQYDFTEFTNKSKRIFHYFKMKPIIEGGVCQSLQDHSYSHINAVIEGNGWKIGRVSGNSSQYPSQHHSTGSSVVAIMGNIAYPVNADKIIGEEQEQSNDAIQKWNRTFKKADVNNWKNLVREILNSGLYLEIQFDIGELEMDVSREGLQYTKNVIKVLRDRTQEIYLTLKEDMSKKLEACTNLVDAYQTYYNLSDLAGGWTAGASWADSSGKVHELTSGKDLEYTFKKNKQLYAFNFRSAGYRSRRMVYLTDKIHYQTLQGVPEYYWSGAKKSGKMVFFRCDVKSAETAKKIVTRYCNTNDCYAYLMVDSDTPEDSTEGFDNLIKDIGGESNVVNVSDYRSLLNSGTRSQTRDKTGQISADEIFLLSASPDAKNKNVLQGKDLNDSSYLRELGEDMLNDLEDETIVYLPIIRYAVPQNYPTISEISGVMKDQKHSLNKLFDSQNIFAIKQSSVEKLRKQGYDLVDFNEWFKPQLKKSMQKLCDKVSVYKDIVEYCKNQYDTEEGKTDRYYYNRVKSDRKIVTELINIFGINYKNYIGGTTLCDQLDKWMIYNFFAKIMHTNFDMKFCAKTEYYTVMAEILEKHNLNGIDPEKVKESHAEFLTLKYHITSLYNEDYASSIVCKSKQSEDFFKSMPSMVQLRKNLKVEVDKVAMMKYIVGVVFDSNESDLSHISSNPMTIHHNTYYGAPEWYKTFGEDKIEEMRNLLGGMVK
jgi:hypothetical protein